jgi:hypothetical protein
MTLMRNGRDRRLGKPGMGHATLERVFLFGTRSADSIRASGLGGRVVMGTSSPFENRPDTWQTFHRKLISRPLGLIAAFWGAAQLDQAAG